MVKAHLVEYVIRRFSTGIRSTKFPSDPAKAVYVPSEQMFVRRDSSSNLIAGPFYQMYEVLMGQEAQKAYDELLRKLNDPTYQQIDVPDSFVTWARSVHEARNPPKEISDLLSPF